MCVLFLSLLILQKKWKKYMKERPVEPDFPALEAAFYAQPRHAHLRSVQTLHDEAQLLLWKTIKEMRKFVAAKEDKVSIASNVLYMDIIQLF